MLNDLLQVRTKDGVLIWINEARVSSISAAGNDSNVFLITFAGGGIEITREELKRIAPAIEPDALSSVIVPFKR